MAIITATAIAGGSIAAGTITAGTIAAGAAFAASTAGTAVSLSQSSKQKKAQRDAEKAADEALKSAKKQLEVNYLEGLSVPKETYELQREAGLIGSAQLLQAATEGDQRGAAAGAGRANVFNQAAQTKARVDMSKELMDLQKVAAEEDARLQGLKTKVDLAEVAGQQAAAQQAALNRSAAQGRVMKGIAGMGAIAGKQIPEYLNQGNPLPGGTLPDVDTSIQGMVNTVQPQYNRSFGDPFPSIFDRNFQTPQIAFPELINIPSISAGGQFSNFQ